MKAIAVIPGKPNTVHLTEMPAPQVDEFPTAAACWSEFYALASTARIRKSTLPNMAKRRRDMTSSYRS